MSVISDVSIQLKLPLTPNSVIPILTNLRKWSKFLAPIIPLNLLKLRRLLIIRFNFIDILPV
jgi:hypothetical protein